MEWKGWKDWYDRGLTGYELVGLTRLGVLLALLIAEIVTLIELTGTTFDNPRPQFVFGAMVAGFAAVVVVALPRGDRPD